MLSMLGLGRWLRGSSFPKDGSCNCGSASLTRDYWEYALNGSYDDTQA